MGSHPDRTGTAPQQLRHGLGVQPCDHAQHDHLGLKWRQGGYKRDRPLGGQVVQREICGIGALGICPVVKRIWTPSWTLFSGGWCLLLTAAFYVVIEIWNRRAWAFGLLVIGMNSIAAYCIAHLFDDFISKAEPKYEGWIMYDPRGRHGWSPKPLPELMKEMMARVGK